MGRSTSGIYPASNGTWQVDKWSHGTRLRQRGFRDFEEAQRWLIKRQNELRETRLHGERPQRLFSEAAAHYLLLHQDKASIVTETYLLQSVMPAIGHLPLTRVHDSTLAPYVQKRLADGRAHKTVNLALGVVRRILNLAASSWRDENGTTWLAQAPRITLLPLSGHQREPKPLSWAQQRLLLPRLPAHLARMALFDLNTGVRDDVVCNLRWAWEIKVPELGISVFEVPREHVKGRRRARLVVCNSVAQSIVESVRGEHPQFVFVFRGHGRRGAPADPDDEQLGVAACAQTSRTGRSARARPAAHDRYAVEGSRRAGADHCRHLVAHRALDDASLQHGADRRDPCRAGEDRQRQRSLEQEPGNAQARATTTRRGDEGGRESPKSPPSKKKRPREGSL
jgi:integrase